VLRKIREFVSLAMLKLKKKPNKGRLISVIVGKEGKRVDRE